ncbi:MAG: SDR family oxidoreductase [Armatimonadota bacterium]|nr:SDR family oxidoreductase [bacterium]
MTEQASEKREFEPELQKLEGKVALVTGGTSGIGRATANLLAKHGVKVVIYGRHEQELHDALDDLERTGGEFFGLTADQAYEDQIIEVFQKVKERFGDIDILVNNAALPAKSILDMSYDEALYVLRVNILGYLTCMREAIKMMRDKGGGQIVNVGSMSAQVREVGSDVYVATKAAIEAMSESLRKNLADQNIRISVIEPGMVGTNLHGEPPDVESQVDAEAEGQMLEAEDIAHAIHYALTQPLRSSVLEIRVAPIKQAL